MKNILRRKKDYQKEESTPRSRLDLKAMEPASPGVPSLVRAKQ